MDKSPQQIAQELKKAATVTPTKEIRRIVVEELEEQEVKALSRFLEFLNVDDTDTDNNAEAKENKNIEDDVEARVEKKIYQQNEYEKFRRWYDTIKKACSEAELESRLKTGTHLFLDAEWIGKNLEDYYKRILEDDKTLRMSKYTVMFNNMVMGKRFEEAYKLWSRHERKHFPTWTKFLEFIQLTEYNERHVRRLRTLYAQFKLYPRALWIPSSMNKIYKYADYFVKFVETDKDELLFWRKAFIPSAKLTEYDALRPTPIIKAAESVERKVLINSINEQIEAEKNDKINNVITQQYSTDAIKQTNEQLKNPAELKASK